MPLWFNVKDPSCSETKLPQVGERDSNSGKWPGRTLASLSDSVRDERNLCRPVGGAVLGRPRTSNPFLDDKLKNYCKAQPRSIPISTSGKNVCRPLQKRKPHAVNVWKNDEIDKSAVRLTDRPTTANPTLDRAVANRSPVSNSFRKQNIISLSTPDIWVPDTLDNCFHSFGNRPTTTKVLSKDFSENFEKQSTQQTSKSTIQLVNPDSFQVLWCSEGSNKKAARNSKISESTSLSTLSTEINIGKESRRKNSFQKLYSRGQDSGSSVCFEQSQRLMEKPTGNIYSGFDLDHIPENKQTPDRDSTSFLFDTNIQSWRRASHQRIEEREIFSESESQQRISIENSESSMRKSLIDLIRYLHLSTTTKRNHHMDDPSRNDIML